MSQSDIFSAVCKKNIAGLGCRSELIILIQIQIRAFVCAQNCNQKVKENHATSVNKALILASNPMFLNSDLQHCLVFIQYMYTSSKK